MNDSSYDEDALLALSGIQHFAYCARQWALIHLEGQWSESVATVEGRHLHDRVHSRLSTEARGDILVARSLALVSRRLGLYGVADVVEFLRPVHESEDCLVELPGRTGKWVVRPVEYKRGRAKPDERDEVQLCAQAICLEEMLGAKVLSGCIFYGKTQSRVLVEFTQALRDRVEQLAKEMHSAFERRVIPPPGPLSKCGLCSLMDVCLPKAVSRRGRQVQQWVVRMVSLIDKDTGGAI